MGALNTAIVLASETAGEEGSQLSPYVFGAATFIILGLLLVITMMLKVGD
jgi:hypothetical protein